MRRVAILLAVLAVLASATVARAEPVRILVAAGASTGLAGDAPLAHPQRDATRVRDVFVSLGRVRVDDTVLVQDPTKAGLLAALERAQALARQRAPNGVTFIFYFSGHGDHEALHLRGESLSIADLRARIAQIPAGLRISVVDACRTRESLRAKGMTVQPGFTVHVPASNPAAGLVWLSASADGEAAQESDELGGAVFTQFWLAGLRGAADTNADGRVTLEESFSYGYHQTLYRSARSSGVVQRPEARMELTESGPLVLTDVGGPRAQLEFPREADSLYLVYALGSQTVAAEVYGSPDRATRLALAPGRYIVQKRSGARGAATETTLSAGAVRVLAASEFRPFSGEVLARKGEVVVRPWSIALSNGLFAGTAADLGDEISVRFERRDQEWAYAVSALGGYAGQDRAFHVAREWHAGAELSLDHVFVLGSLLALRTGLDARAQWIWQTLRRADAERLERAGFGEHATETNHSGAAAGAGLHAGVRYALSSRLFADGGIRALALGVNTPSGLDSRLLLGGWLAAGAMF